MNYIAYQYHSKKRDGALLVLTSLFLMLITSCATTSLTSVWMDESYQGGPLKNVLILGIMHPGELRATVEDTLALQLERRGIKTVKSYTLFSEDTLPEKNEIEKKVQEKNIDTVFVIRFLRIDDISLYLTYPPYVNNDLYGYYSYCCQNIVSSGYHVSFESTLFDAATQKVIWAAPSDTQLERTRESIVESYVDVVLENLSANKLIR